MEIATDKEKQIFSHAAKFSPGSNHIFGLVIPSIQDTLQPCICHEYFIEQKLLLCYPIPPLYYGELVIDIHCHILPATDDGPNTMETSLAMAAIAADDGIHTIIATPHTDGIRVSRESVIKSVARMNMELQMHKNSVRILPGYEIPFHLVSELGPTHTMAGSNYVLLEFPHDYIPQSAASMLYNLVYSGLQPIIAHPERNYEVLANPSRLAELVDTGALVQLTACSITGDLGPDIQRCAYYLLKNGIGDFIATDSHSPAFRAPVLTKAYTIVKKLLGKEKADLLTIGNPGKIIYDAQ